MSNTITAVFDSSEDEDSLQPFEHFTFTTQDRSTLTQTAVDTALSAELSKISHEYEHAGEMYAHLQHNVENFWAKSSTTLLTGAQASEVLSCLGLSAGALTAVGQSTLTHIVAIAHSLQLQGCEKYMFLIALIQLGERQHGLHCAQVKRASS